MRLGSQPSTARTPPLTESCSTASGPTGSLGRCERAYDQTCESGPKRLDGVVYRGTMSPAFRGTTAADALAVWLLL